MAPARGGVGILPPVWKTGQSEVAAASQFQTLSSETTPTTRNGWDPGDFLESSVSVEIRVDTTRAYGHPFSPKRFRRGGFTTGNATDPRIGSLLPTSTYTLRIQTSSEAATARTEPWGLCRRDQSASTLYDLTVEDPQSNSGFRRDVSPLSTRSPVISVRKPPLIPSPQNGYADPTTER